jgi:DNA-binding MarR family transcriptional regulator
MTITAFDIGNIPPQLRESMLHGKGAEDIKWGRDGDFDACRRFLAEHGVPSKFWDGECAELHKEATGFWPGKGRSHEHSCLDLDVLVAAMGAYKPIKWRGPLAWIGEPTGDKRFFPPGTMKYQTFPQPLRWQEHSGLGHQGAVTVATIQKAEEGLWKGRPAIVGEGTFLNPDIIPEVHKAVHQIEQGVTGPSVDLDSFTAALLDHGGQKVAAMRNGRQRAATLVAVPAFADLRLELQHPEDDVTPFDLDTESFAVNASGWHGAPIAPRDAKFDADDAVSRIEQWAGGDAKKMSSVFLWNATPSDSNTQDVPLGRENYRLPWGDIIDGKPYIIYHAIYAASALLEGGHGGLPNIPDAEKARLRDTISEIYARMSEHFGDPHMRASWDAAKPGERNAVTASADEFAGRYTEHKHPRWPRGAPEDVPHHRGKGGEWTDVPGHGPHGQILKGGKYVYPPRNKDHVPRHAAPEHEGKHRAPGDQTNETGHRYHRNKHAGPYRHHGGHRAEDQPKTEPKAPEKKTEAKKVEPKAPEKAQAKKSATVRVAKAKATTEHKLTSSQESTLRTIHSHGGSVAAGSKHRGLHSASVGVLERHGFVERKKDRGGQEHIHITEKGRTAVGLRGAHVPEKPETSAKDHVKALRAMKSRDEVRAYVGKLNKSQLMSIIGEQDRQIAEQGRHLRSSASSRDTAQELRDKIVRFEGSRIDADILSGRSSAQKANTASTLGKQPKVSGHNPSVITGADWRQSLKEDTPPQGIPVHDLKVSQFYDYKIDRGTVFRKDGIIYLVEHGEGVIPQQIARELRSIHAKLPPDAARYQKSYAWLQGRNPGDKHWEKEYNIPGFTSFATAGGGDGQTHVWAQKDYPGTPSKVANELNHEFGHNVSREVPNDLSEFSPRWSQAGLDDSSSKRPKFSPNVTLMVGNHAIKLTPDHSKGYPHGVTNYGQSAVAEDYAESVQLYLRGELGQGKVDGPDGPVFFKAYFRDLFPNRAKILDKVFPKFAEEQMKLIKKQREHA